MTGATETVETTVGKTMVRGGTTGASVTKGKTLQGEATDELVCGVSPRRKAVQAVRRSLLLRLCPRDLVMT